MPLEMSSGLAMAVCAAPEGMPIFWVWSNCSSGGRWMSANGPSCRLNLSTFKLAAIFRISLTDSTAREVTRTAGLGRDDRICYERLRAFRARSLVDDHRAG